MQRCERCHIDIRGNKMCCPLCEGPLTGEPEDPGYPYIRRRKIGRLLAVKIVCFLFVVFEIAMITIQLMTKTKIAWIPMAMLIGVIGLADVLLSVFYYHRFVKMLTVQVYLGMLIAFAADRFSGFRGWSVTWLFPACFTGLFLVTLVIGSLVGTTLDDLVMYLLLDLILCVGVQLLLILLGLNHFTWPAAISIALLLCISAGIVLFRFRDFRTAAERYFNM